MKPVVLEDAAAAAVLTDVRHRLLLLDVVDRQQLSTTHTHTHARARAHHVINRITVYLPSLSILQSVCLCLTVPLLLLHPWEG